MSVNELNKMQLTNEQLIAKAVATLERVSKIDTTLLDLLSEHILKSNPEITAVSDALKEIEALAEKRAEKHKG